MASFGGLPLNSSFTFALYPYTNSGSEIDFKTDGSVPTATASTEATIGQTATKAATGTIAIESDGPNEDDIFYSQNDGSEFVEYSLAAFTVTSADLGISEAGSVNSAFLRLTVNDRGFSESGEFRILFTPDDPDVLGSGEPYDSLFFDGAQPLGINPAQFPTAPVEVATSIYPFGSGEGGGEQVIVELDLSAVQDQVVAAINEESSFHFIIGSPASGGAAATFSGVENSFDPGDPQLFLDVSEAAADPEPTAQASDFVAVASGTSINLSWTDAAGGRPRPDGLFALGFRHGCVH